MPAASASNSKPLTLKNISALPLNFVLRTQVPFTVDSWEFSLEPGESATLNVEFDPGYRDDRQSHIAKGKLIAVYREHPQKDSFELVGEINFPNVQFDTLRLVLNKVSNVFKIDQHSKFLEIEAGQNI